MKHQAAKRFSAFIVCAIMMLSLLPNITLAAKAEECPLYGTHKLDGAVMFEADHPHKQYVVCDCGYAQYTGTTLDYYAECAVCNSQECQHLHTEEAWDTNYSIQYTSISDTEHQAKGYLYQYCTDCGNRVGESYPGTEVYGHDFNSNGDCPTCGYTHACSHSKTKLVAIDGFPSYTPYSETQHIVDIQYKEVCTDCGETVKQIVDSARDYYYEDHDFNSKGKCRDCGYVKPEEQEELKISVSAGQSSAEVGTLITASATATGGDGSYSYAWKVTCNGNEIANTDLSYGNNYSVTANTEGTYIFTATVQDGNGNQATGSSSAITVTKPACTHPTTEVAWDTNYPMKYESISDTQHKVSGYQYRYCTDCFNRVGDSFEATETVAHDFDANGDCPTCGYTKECKHTNTKYVVIDGFPSCEYYNDEEHTIDTQYKEVCDDCGKTVKNVVDSQRTYVHEPHSFGSDGKCTGCGFIKPEAQEELKISVSAGQSKVEVGALISATATATGGTGSYNFAWKVTCNGNEIANTDLSYGNNYSVTATAEGSYIFTATVQDSKGNQATGSSSAITAEKPACTHPTTEVAWDTNYPMKYESVSDTQHKVSGYQYRYCTECLQRVGESFEATETVAHDFDAAGDCPTCGYTVSCKHENTKLVEIDGFPTYHQYDEKQHIYDVQYKEVCTNPTCGKTVKNIVDSARIYEYQDHRFDENGKCQNCGYIKAEDQVALEVVVSRGQATAKTGETISASATATGGDGNYKYSWKVLCDGNELNTTDLGMGDSYNWKAEIAGTYIFSVTVVDGNNDSATGNSQGIVVSQNECTHETYTDVPRTVTYEQVSDTKHNKITLMSRVCDVCKETISEYKKTESEDHTFENGKCTGCGLAEPTEDCAHEHTEEVLAGSEITGQGNTEQHIRTEKYNVICNDCKETIRVISKNVMENHSFNADGVCVCGYAKPKPDCDHANRVEVEISAPSYVNNGESGHTKTVKVRVECADCGITLEEEKTNTVTEGHSFENGVCACGQLEHVHTFKKEILSTQYVNQNYSEHDVITTYNTVCSGCGLTNGPFTDTVREGHSYTDKGHIEAKHQAGVGHATFDKCSCGAVLYTGYAKYNNCCDCYGHSWGDIYPQNGYLIHKCTRCGVTEQLMKVDEAIEAGKEAYEQIITPLFNVSPEEKQVLTEEVKQQTIAESFAPTDSQKMVESNSYIPKVDDWKNDYTLFDASVEDVLDSSDNLIHRWAKAFYQGAHIVGTTKELFQNESEEEKLEDMMVSILKENFVNYLAEKELNDLSWLDTKLDQTISNEGIVDALFDVINCEIPTGYGDYFSLRIDKSDTSDNFDISDIGWDVVLDGITISCKTLEEVKITSAMLINYKRAMAYVDNLEKYAVNDSILQSACKTMRDSISSDYFGTILDEHKKQTTNLILEYAAESGMVALYESEAIQAGAQAARNVATSIVKGGKGLIKEIKVDVQSMKLGGINTILSDVAGTFLAWEVGATIGDLVTYGTGKMIEDEDKLLRLYVINSEIDQALATAKQKGDEDAIYDLTSLLMTSQEEGVVASRDYYAHYNVTWKNMIYNVIANWTNQPTTATTKEIDNVLNSEKKRINAVRATMGLSKKEKSKPAQPTFDFEIYDPGAGDRMPAGSW